MTTPALHVCDTSGTFWRVVPGRRAVEIQSEADFLNPEALSLMPTSARAFGLIEQDPDAPMALEVVEIGKACRYCDHGKWTGPCRYDTNGVIHAVSEDTDRFVIATIDCPECLGTGNWYEWTGCHLTLAQLIEWSDAAAMNSERRSA